MAPLLSLCIPTNGKTEWIIPVIDSIYDTEVNEEEYEVIIENNSPDYELEKALQKHCQIHRNLHCYHSNADGFLCQIDCFKHAEGEFIKFINHRMKIVRGAVAFLLDFAQKYRKERPVVFFSDGRMQAKESDSFDEFVRNLGYWSSWSGGLAFWKEDIPVFTQHNSYNSLFPHTDVLFLYTHKNHYIIKGEKLFEEIDAGHSAKGKYNLFWAFSVEYIDIIKKLLEQKSITIETFLAVKDSMLDFVADLYNQFIVHHKAASYELDHYREYVQIYYSDRMIKRRAIKRRIVHAIGKLTGEKKG